MGSFQKPPVIFLDAFTIAEIHVFEKIIFSKNNAWPQILLTIRTFHNRGRDLSYYWCPNLIWNLHDIGHNVFTLSVSVFFRYFPEPKYQKILFFLGNLTFHESFFWIVQKIFFEKVDKNRITKSKYNFIAIRIGALSASEKHSKV